MKIIAIAIAATLFSLLLATNLHAQKCATWKGGTPGRTTDWNCASNWKEGRVPNEFSSVIIPDVSTTTGYHPSIASNVEAISSLQVLPGASLTIAESGALEVLNWTQVSNATQIVIAGYLTINSTVAVFEKGK